ncbi:hypothetical protein [Selenomonas sp. FC4001]|uniref:hypothetical protein n=1 Tax=Selenomonas sp. FC4001 TaxID=1408313 RepID=UPI0018CC67B4|nr:hypothetical protein [Selenomonas sp. FC4001]
MSTKATESVCCEVDRFPVHPSRRTQTNRMNDKQAATSPSGHIEAQRAGGTAARVILLLSRWPP